MKFSQLLYAAALLLLAFSSCKKDEDSGVDKIVGVWQITSSRSDVDGDGDLDDDLENCSRDDEFDFQKSGTLAFDEGATKCDPTDPQTETGAWALSTDEKTLTLTIDGFGLGYQVLSLTSKKMELRAEFFGSTLEAVFEKK